METINYSFLDRLLHRIALGFRPAAELSYEIDQILAGPTDKSVVSLRHVFVSGLARAGTTVLMRRFHATGQFRSLTYRDMPFVLAPGLWRKLSSFSRREMAPAERAHGDGLTVDFDSPEGLEEVFWRVFEGSEYLRGQLRPHQPRSETLGRYVRYVQAILSTDAPGKRYLSKNNNHILRLEAISQVFPNAALLIPFREPLQQASSLKNQHERFCALQKESAFTLSYMNWLGHHEFGLGHRPFVPPGAPSRSIAEGLNYWVALWCDVHEWLMASRPESAIFVCYEDLCNDAGYWPRLAELTGVAAHTPGCQPFKLKTRTVDEPVDPQLVRRAEGIYARLVTQSRAHHVKSAQGATGCGGDGAEQRQSAGG